MTSLLKTIVYVDGLNVFHGITIPFNCPRLDFFAFTQINLGRDYDIFLMRYYTTYLLNPNKEDTQKFFINKSNELYRDKFVSTEGRFLKKTPRGQCRFCKKEGAYRVVEEKRSDVNLASDMVRDSLSLDIDCVVLVSNDSDLVRPLQIAREKGVRIVLLSPIKEKDRTKIPGDLRGLAHVHRIMDKRKIKKCLFPE